MTAAHCDDLASLAARSEIAHVDEHVYLANWFAAKKRAKLAAAGITHVLVCAAEFAPAFPQDPALVYRHLALRDNPGQRLPIAEALAFLADAAAAGGRVLLHCAAGGSRSAALALAWLMQTRGIGYDEALALLRSRRWVDPNAGFEAQLRAFEASRGEGSSDS